MSKESLKNQDVSSLIENLWDAIYIVDENRRITHWNKAAENLTGYMRERVVGKSCGKDLLAHHCDSTILCDVGCPLTQTMHDGETREAQVSLKNQHGQSVPIFVRIMPYHNKEGKVNGVIEIFRKLDGVDEASPLLNQLEHMAYVEPLTKAARRNYGEMVLKNALTSFNSYGVPFAVLLLDLDHFKPINDTYGHQAGDLALQGVARLIQENLRSSDLLVRWGGDEFLIIVPHIDAKRLAIMAQKLCELVAQANFAYQGAQFGVTLSVGGALPVLGESMESLLARADQSMYQAKTARNTFAIAAMPEVRLA